VRNHRWANPAGLDRWVAAYAETGRPPRPRPVPEDLARFEYVFLHLRLSEGLDPGGYRERWGRRFEDDYADPLERMVDRGLLVRAGGRIRLAPRARFVSDAVFAEFAPAES
jgi:coproporphyrinogen III oxidase-like Fe-S oxidoreductase